MKTLPVKKILGMTCHPLSLDDATELIMNWARGQDKGKYVIQGNVYTVMNTLDDFDYKKIVTDASLILPDGRPISWVSRLKGASVCNNVRGLDLMMHCLRSSAKQGIRHFFYGGKQETLDKAERKIAKQFSDVSLAGVYSPPFRPLSQSEDEEICRMINKSGADILWVGLGAPKQDIWMHQHRDKLNVKVMIGVGAAFDFFAGNIKQAPVFMQKSGLEWLYRLCQEPRRLWARYLINNPKFLYYNVLEFLKLRKFIFILAAIGTLFFSSSDSGYCKNIKNFNDNAWENNSQWADVKVSAHQEGVVEGVGKVYRIECKSFKEGAVQFVRFVNDFPLKRNIPYRIEIYLKGELRSPVEVLLRQRGAPYRTYIKRSFVLGDKWKKYSYIILTPEDIDGYYLMIRFLERGTVYIGDAKIEKEAVDSPKRIDDHAVNLIDNGSFEVGLDRWGASLSENASSYEMQICASNIQPITATSVKTSGKRSLQLTIPEHATVTLTSGYFSVPQSGEYVLSCYLRSNALRPMHVSLGISPYYFGQDNYTSEDFSVGREWKKYLIKSRLYALKDVRYFVRLASDEPGVLWVDSVQLSQKDTVNFVPAKAAEVGFERRDSSIFRTGEDLGLLLNIYAHKPVNAQLQLSSTDFWGSGSVLYDQPLNLKAGEFRQVKISYPSLKTGYYLVKAELRSPEGAGDVAETAIGIVPVLPSAKIANSPFGGHAYFNKDRLQEAGLLGIQWLRMHPPSGTKWFIIEKEKGKFVYPDEEIKLAKDLGFAILGSLDTTPRWASSAPVDMKNESFDGYRSFMPKNIKDWKHYVTNTVAHYKGVIDHWEIWNEPDSDFFHNLGGKNQKAKDYVLLLKAGYEAAKSANPQCVIVGGVGCTQPFDRWLEAIAREGALGYLDVVSFHGYLSDENAFNDESAVRESVQAIKKIIIKYGKGKMIPVWDTESGAMFIGSSYTNIKEVFPESPMRGTDGPGYVVRRMVNLLTSGAEKWFYYSLNSSNRSDRKECMGFFDWDNTPRPLAVAYAVMASLIGDKHFIKEMVLDKTVYCAEFKNDNGGRVKVAWTENEEKTVEIDVGNAHSVKIIDMMGNEIKKTVIGEKRILVLLSKNPVYLIE